RADLRRERRSPGRPGRRDALGLSLLLPAPRSVARLLGARREDPGRRVPRQEVHGTAARGELDRQRRRPPGGAARGRARVPSRHAGDAAHHAAHARGVPGRGPRSDDVDADLQRARYALALRHGRRAAGQGPPDVERMTAMIRTTRSPRTLPPAAFAAVAAVVAALS